MHLFRRLGPSRGHRTEATQEWEEKEGTDLTDGRGREELSH